MTKPSLTTLAGDPPLAVDRIGRGPPVVFMHGIGGNRGNWRGQLASFSEEFTCFAWDARGYGDSGDYLGPLRFEDLCSDLDRLLDTFKIETAHLIGLSMGARIALDYYGRQPQRVATLSLCSARTSESESEEHIQEFLRLRRRPLIEEGLTPSDIAPTVAKTLVAPNATPQALAALIESLSALHTDSYLKALETLTRYRGFPQYDTVEVPTLVVVGEHDRSVRPEHGRSMADALPQGSLRIIAGAGHLTNLERPEEFNQAIGEFLRAHAQRARFTHARLTEDGRGVAQIR